MTRNLRQWIVRRKRPPRLRKPPLTEALILQWADDHRRHHGEWPTADSGRIRIALNENWLAVSMALRAGVRGLNGGSSLARLLAKHRNVRNKKGLPQLTVKQILAWADAYHDRTGRWPTASSGPIPEASPGETWAYLDGALHQGCRGFSHGMSVAWILAEHRGVGRYYTAPPLSESKILKWADNYHRRTGKWPTVSEEIIPESDGDRWKSIDGCLRRGARRLRGGTSLAQLLGHRRNVRNVTNRPPLTTKQILAWADAHHKRTGKWPTENTGAVTDADGESWEQIDAALRGGRRGLPGGGSLPRLLESSGRHRNRKNLPHFLPATILKWADEHFRRTGRWPNAKSGKIGLAPDETWNVVDNALRAGIRGLKGGSSLLRLLMRHRGISNPQDPPRLSMKQIYEWADDHRNRTGRWPQCGSGPILAEPGTTWSAVNDALRSGRRGFPGGSSLSIALAPHRRRSRFEK